MKQSLGGVVEKRYDRVIGIDASSSAVGVALIEKGRPVALIALRVPKGDIMERLAAIRDSIGAILDHYHADFIMVEAPIYIRNPQTTKTLAYVVGIIFGEALHRKIEIQDVSPLDWKLWLGYKKLTRSIQGEIISRLGPKEGRAEIQRLRKSQVQDILRERYPQFDWSDDDLADGAGIGLYAYSQRGTKV